MNKQKSSFGYNQKKYLSSVKNLTKVKIDSNQLMKKYGLTIDEIKLLNQLDVFKQYENIPTRTNGIKNGKFVEAHPISVAAYDLYYGMHKILNNGVQISNDYIIFGNLAFNLLETKSNMNLAKSIFNKVSPHLYSKCF
ncbi:hypothetical protein [Flavobacterium sp. GCM10023249]|uniref:hypothetical protein n=1 Tax=unclassified Flavobacterium TaxID=196869 RepID=UPI00360DC51E